MTEPYGVGTVTVTNGGTVVTGIGTFWVGKVRKNDLFTDPAQGLFARVTADPTENDELAINGWPGTNLVDGEYEIISTYIAVDTASRTRELLLGLSLIDPNYDAHVDTLPDRAAYDDKPGPTPTTRGFAVLVDDIGDGSSAVYSKKSNSTADWSGGARYSGPTGAKGWSPQLVAEANGERRVLKLAGYVGGEGTAPTANVGQYLEANGTWTSTIANAVDFRGEGFIPRGPYNAVTAYAKGNVTTNAGSSWIALQPTTGNAPPTLPATSNAYWALLAQKGQDGTGTGTVVGPASSTLGRLAVYGDGTGTLIGQTGALTAAQQSLARGDLGLNVLSEERDKIINGQFEVCQRTLPVAIATSGTGIDCWGVVTVAGITASVSRAALPAGDARGKYFMQVAFAGSGASGSFVRHRIPGVGSHAGKKATLAFSAADSAATAGVVQIRQFFGTGGSPSAAVASNTPIALGAPLSPYQLVLDIPSIAGKTLGTIGDDYLEILFIPTAANTHTFSLGNVRFDEGDTTNETSLPVRSFQRQEDLCKWFYEVREIGTNGVVAVAQAYTTTGCAWELQYRPKRVPPSISVPTNLVPLSATGAAQTVSSHTPTAIGRDSARVTTTIAAAALVAGNAAAILTSAGARIVIDAEYA